ncbi:MAG: L-rhamnose mutarotase [Chitinophagaceae bacterium]|jgi:L-rhamnose mutarotase|nr:L-rhamnose mutarotase [Chitinophagaceae bacterium]OQY96043.1 MAG: L-fucose mutarotase [Sphingobacteriales bacterium UTBCD1]
MNTQKRYCLALDLKDDPALIAEYEKYHQQVWPEIIESIKDSGIEKLDIYRVTNRLFMIIEANESFSFEKKSAADSVNPKVQQWEELMWKFQQAIPGSKPGEKWMLMKKIFFLDEE